MYLVVLYDLYSQTLSPGHKIYPSPHWHFVINYN
jgi:hypothetical protein